MSADPTIDQLYEQQIKALPRAAKLRLLARIAEHSAHYPLFAAREIVPQEGT